jgi:probable HAF family extracellular repeat protein
MLLVLAQTAFVSPGEAASLTALGNPLGWAYSVAWGVSADGSVVVGTAYRIASSRLEAFRWTKDTGMVGLGPLPGGGATMAYAVSADGNVVAGWDRYPNGWTNQAFRWTSAGGMVGLGFLDQGLRTQASRLTIENHWPGA